MTIVPPSHPLSKLVEELHKLPGIGPKTAQRLAYFLLRAPREQAQALSQAILELKDKVVLCSQCQNISGSDPCHLCLDEERDKGVICIAENPLDVLALERSGTYQGVYHVLHGAISPMDGIGPDDLKIRELLARLERVEVREVILATNPNLEGEATAMYLQRLLVPLGVKLTRLARGLPFGSDLEYADEVTLSRALEGRQPL